MVKLAIASFLIAALFGVYLAVRHIKDDPPSIKLAPLHGIFVFAGLLCLFIAAGQKVLPPAGVVGLTILLLVASVGVVQVIMHYCKYPLPPLLLKMHGIAGALGLAIIILAELRIV